ncbi:MAG: hypothetical protein ACRDT2_11005 [Natronosporangium sp.]
MTGRHIGSSDGLPPIPELADDATPEQLVRALDDLLSDAEQHVVPYLHQLNQACLTDPVQRAILGDNLLRMVHITDQMEAGLPAARAAWRELTTELAAKRRRAPGGDEELPTPE